MLDKSISLYSINLFLNELANELYRIDNSLVFVRFGSSLKEIPEENLDLDILLISENRYFDLDIYKAIDVLKNHLLSGKNVLGFGLENELLTSTINSYLLKQTHLLNSNIYPKFVFGPFLPQTNTNSTSNIYLHFKGPITQKEFKYFCRKLPFHGYSIIINHQIISKKINGDIFSEFCRLDTKSLSKFNKGLRIRVKNSNSIQEVNKCIKKLLLNCNLYLEVNKMKMKLPTTSDISSSINDQKKIFNDYYSISKKLI